MSGILAQNIQDNSGLIKAPEGGGAWNFIKKVTASSSATISFVNGSSDVVFDSTYKMYVLFLNGVHRSTTGNEQTLTFNLSSDGGSNYNVTKTTTLFDTFHRENGTSTGVNYNTGQDLAQSTGFLNITPEVEFGEDNDASLSGVIYFYNPASTTFTKNFEIETNFMSFYSTPWTIRAFIGGYGNTTSAVDAFQFKMSSGNIDAGQFTLYGITT